MILKRNFYPLLIVIILSILALIPLFQTGFFGYDFVYQCARLASFYKNLQEGVILPRWAGQLNADYGHPVLIFLYPFIFYLGSLWHFLGFSLVNSIKILFVLGFLFSGIFWYLFAKKLWGSKIALVSSLLYLFTPYRFVNIYGRAALGEHLGISFLPLIFLSLVNIFQDKKTTLRGSLSLGLSLALVILSHNLIILTAFPLIFAFFLFLQSTFKKGNLKLKFFLVVLGGLIGLSLSSFFWMPVLFERKYIRYDEIANPSYYSFNLLKSRQIFLSSNYQLDNLLSLPDASRDSHLLFPTISFTQWFLLLFVFSFLYKFWQKSKKEAFFVLFLIFYFGLGAFLSIDLSFPLVEAFPPIALFQHSFRFLNLPLFASPFFLAIIAKSLAKKRLNFFLIFLTIFNLAINLPYFWNLKIPRDFKDDAYFYKEYQLTADTGPISPKWSLINYFEAAPGPVQLVSGGLDEVKIHKWDSQEHRYTLKLREDSQIADNTLYFPGWKVWVDGVQVPINFQDMNWRGIITYPVSKGEHKIEVKFTETRLRLLADYLSLISFVFLAIGFLITFVSL